MDNSMSIHYKNLQRLATELYKIFSGISPDVINLLFKICKFSVTFALGSKNKGTYFS